jgi:tRNA-dihydrouridine synthase
MGERKGVYRILVGKSEGKKHLEEPGVDGRIILRRIFRNSDLAQEMDMWRAFVKCEEFFD